MSGIIMIADRCTAIAFMTIFEGMDFPLDRKPGRMVSLRFVNTEQVDFQGGTGMYAVIHTGGKQYKVAPGDMLKVEKLDAKKGDTVEIKDVFLIVDGENVNVGRPTIANAKVTAEVLGEVRGEKLLIFKHRRRKGYRKTTGHRQDFTSIKVKEIKA
jgi:large subunit ribosomal protein L21